MTICKKNQRNANSTYPNGGVSCSKDNFVVNQTLVFQIKFCGKSPALRVAAKRQLQLITNYMEMNKKTKTIIGVLVIWNIVLSAFIFVNQQQNAKTENMVRNIYNKATTISFEELNEEGSRWGFHGRDME